MQWIISKIPNSFWHNMLDNLPKDWENRQAYTLDKDYKYVKIK